MDRRLQLRHQSLVKSQMSAAFRTAAGPSLLPEGTHAAAVTQAAWRFYNNPRVSLSALIQPLRKIGLKETAQSSSEFVLLAHDWSKLDYGTHSSKRDRCQLIHQSDIGYDLTTALLIDAHEGAPLAPMEMHLKTAHAVHSTSASPPVVTDHHLDQLLPMMDSSREWNLPRRVVHGFPRQLKLQLFDSACQALLKLLCFQSGKDPPKVSCEGMSQGSFKNSSNQP